ncbi:acyltransferase family protein [Sanguibacter inulinus]|uniref:Acyltransferase n=1 Tax=Sanguibacter inulinus TaxID=60922 RepID=A0A853EYL9_9MICO|nr:acyltransferase family protein [Sanguibacter inulinus]MBF0722783.1 acyltransferase [Sanguibacter inulinus]NYS93928.1 acyltransferase [Sanguibacter inulinus]
MTDPAATAQRPEARAGREKPGFRADIEGLRAVAIVLVAVYHVWVGRVSGGVDVFLMVSGFFVGASVVRSYAQRRPPSLLPYYRRVLGRLVPPAAIVLVAVVVSTWLVLPRTRMSDTAEQALASLFYVENWYLATTGQAYGAADVSQSMTQHFWSLSVQGQIFLALPLVLLVLTLVLGRRATPKVYLGVVIGLFALSFAYAAYITAVDQASAYYDTGARLWEYLAGTLLAFVIVTRPVRDMAFWLRSVLSAAGLTLIVATGVLVDGGAVFPGPLTLLPLLGAAGIILGGAGERPTAVGAVLSSRPLVTAGAYAYHFYLWHWPVLVLVVALRDGRSPGWLAGAGVLVLSAALAWATREGLSWRARGPEGRGVPQGAGGRRRWRPARLTTALVVGTASFVFVVGAAGGWLAHMAAERRAVLGGGTIDAQVYPGALTRLDPVLWPTEADVAPFPDAVVAREDWPASDREGCAAGPDESRLFSCTFGSEGGALSVALVGGSHSVNFLPAVDAVAAARDVEVQTYFKQGCPVQFFGEDDDREEESSCDVWSRKVVQEVIDSGVDAVMLTGTRPVAGDADGDEVPVSYRAAWDELFDNEVMVIAIRDNPWLPFDGAECVEADGATECTVPRDEVLSTPDPLSELAESIDLLYALDLSDSFCDDLTCYTVIGNVQAYIDSNHLTATFGRTLSTPLDETWGRATGWW